MKYLISIIPILFCSTLSFGQKLTKEEKAQQKVCKKYTETEPDDFSDGIRVASKSIRVGPFLWLRARHESEEKKLFLVLNFPGGMESEINPDEEIEFSLFNSSGKTVVRLIPDIIDKPVITTSSSSGGGSTTVYTRTVYVVGFKLTDEPIETFQNYTLKAVKIKSITGENPILADNEKRAEIFRKATSCVW